MGEMLSLLHYKAWVDARDIEFALGGDGEAGFTFFMSRNYGAITANRKLMYSLRTKYMRVPARLLSPS